MYKYIIIIIVIYLFVIRPTPPSTIPPSSFASQPSEDDEFDDEFEDEFEENQVCRHNKSIVIVALKCALHYTV